MNLKNTNILKIEEDNPERTRRATMFLLKQGKNFAFLALQLLAF